MSVNVLDDGVETHPEYGPLHLSLCAEPYYAPIYERWAHTVKITPSTSAIIMANSKPEATRRAAFIVRAVNNHDNLVQALELALRHARLAEIENGRDELELTEARAVLAKAVRS